MMLRALEYTDVNDPHGMFDIGQNEVRDSGP
jgi:hypothetical protein